MKKSLAYFVYKSCIRVFIFILNLPIKGLIRVKRCFHRSIGSEVAANIILTASLIIILASMGFCYRPQLSIQVIVRNTVIISLALLYISTFLWNVFVIIKSKEKIGFRMFFIPFTIWIKLLSGYDLSYMILRS